ncbi:MAG: spore coat protein U domain-containing protein, partial [Nostoc sp.]
MMLRRFALASVLLIASSAAPAMATGAPEADLGVSASVTANCIISAGTVAFGSYDPVDTNASTPLTGTGTVTTTCTTGASAKIYLDQGGTAA